MNQKIIQRGIWVGKDGASFIIRPLFMALLSYLVVRIEGSDLWGQFVVYLLAVELASVAVGWGQKMYLTREFTSRPNQISALANAAMHARLIILLGAGLVLLFLPLESQIKPWVFTWLVFLFATSLFDALIPYLRSYNQLILADLSNAILVIGGFFLIDAHTIEALIPLVVIGLMVKFLLLLPLWMKHVKFSAFNWELSKQFLRGSLPFFLLTLVGLVQNKADLYVITAFMSKADVALYHILLSFIILSQSFAGVVLRPFEKNIYRISGDGIQKMRRNYMLFGALISAVGAFVIYGILLYIYEFDVNYLLIPFLLLYVIPFYFYLIESHLLIKLKKTNDLIKYSAIAAIVGLGLTYTLVPTWGIYGALIGGVASRMLIAILVNRKVYLTDESA